MKVILIKVFWLRYFRDISKAFDKLEITNSPLKVFILKYFTKARNKGIGQKTIIIRCNPLFCLLSTFMFLMLILIRLDLPRRY